MMDAIKLSVAEYIPYVFQILAQMLTLHRGVPVDYRALLPFLLTPAIWAQKGSIPGLVSLLRAFLACDAAAMVDAGQHIPVLGIVQQRLVPSKANDGWGFELLQSVVLHIPL
jgi:exportin-2 (importin alpha re-exporter)